MANETDPDRRTFLQFLGIIYTFMIPVSVLGAILNTMNIFAIVLAKLHKRTTFKLVLSLAVSDLLIDLGGIFLAASYFVSKYTSDQWQILTLFSQSLFNAGGMTCVGTLVLISFDLLIKT